MPVIDTDGGQMDVISRLLKDRILLLGQGVDDEVANVLVAQLLYLANEDPDKDITLYINSPGGSVSAGMAIYDTMQYVPCDVSTVCFGMAASMGAFLLGAGAKGKRRSLPNSRIMIHQPLGGAQGQAADIEIQAKEILFIREVLNTYIAEYCDQPKDKVEADCDRDFFMTPEEAVAYGIIDEGTCVYCMLLLAWLYRITPFFVRSLFLISFLSLLSLISSTLPRHTLVIVTKTSHITKPAMPIL